MLTALSTALGRCWYTAHLNTHLPNERRDPWSHAGPGLSPTPTTRGGEKVAQAHGAPTPGAVPLPLGNQPVARTALPRRASQTDPLPSWARGGSPKPVWEEVWGQRQGVIREGWGRAGGRTWTIFKNSLPKRPRSYSDESEACGPERGQDPGAPRAVPSAPLVGSAHTGLPRAGR